MIFKQSIIHYLQQTSEQLRLSYQTTLQAIQTLNLLDCYQPRPINILLRQSPPQQQYLALSLLSLCAKLHQKQPPHIKKLAKLVYHQHRDTDIVRADKNGRDTTRDREDKVLSLGQIEQRIKGFQVKIMVWLEWKLAVPMLYDEVLSIALNWDRHTTFFTDFPLRFQTNNSADPQNHNFLASNICVCLYNFTHLITHVPIKFLSQRIRRLSLAIFMVIIRKLISAKVQFSDYVLSPRLSLFKILEDFLLKYYQIPIGQLCNQIRQVEQTLGKYRRFKQKSRDKIKDGKRRSQKKENCQQQKKKTLNKSRKPSEEKENLMYYFHRKNKESYQEYPKYKSRSRSKKQKKSQPKESEVFDVREYRLVRPKDSLLKTFKKKSNSTKSIQYRIPLKKDKQFDKQSKKTLQNHKSKISRKSDKSQLPSKISQDTTSKLIHDEPFCSKSTYWLRSNLTKNDKKSNNSSIRMKLR